MLPSRSQPIAHIHARPTCVNRQREAFVGTAVGAHTLPPGTVTCFQTFAGCSGVEAPSYKEA